MQTHDGQGLALAALSMGWLFGGDKKPASAVSSNPRSRNHDAAQSINALGALRCGAKFCRPTSLESSACGARIARQVYNRHLQLKDRPDQHSDQLEPSIEQSIPCMLCGMPCMCIDGWMEEKHVEQAWP